MNKVYEILKKYIHRFENHRLADVIYRIRFLEEWWHELQKQTCKKRKVTANITLESSRKKLRRRLRESSYDTFSSYLDIYYSKVVNGPLEFESSTNRIKLSFVQPFNFYAIIIFNYD